MVTNILIQWNLYKGYLCKTLTLFWSIAPYGHGQYKTMYSNSLRCHGPVPSILLLFWLSDDIITPICRLPGWNDTDGGMKEGALMTHVSPGREPTSRESSEWNLPQLLEGTIIINYPGNKLHMQANNSWTSLY